MNTEIFNTIPAKEDELRAHEERVCRGILQGIREFQYGNTMPAKDGLASIREHRNWRQRHTE